MHAADHRATLWHAASPLAQVPRGAAQPPYLADAILDHRDVGDIAGQFMISKPPVVQGTMLVPISTAPGIEFPDSLYVNTWRNTIQGPAAVEGLDIVEIKPALALFMRMLREGLCGREDERDLGEMLVISNSRDPEEIEFPFMMNWLRCIIQALGANLRTNMQTNMWLVGKLRDIGRGSRRSTSATTSAPPTSSRPG